MSAGDLFAFNIALLLAIASPGPALLVAMRTTLASGRAAGMRIGLGLGLVAATWTLAALLGFDAIFELFPQVYTIARLLGGLYLVFVAVSLWRSAGLPVESGGGSRSDPFVQGLTINLLNPKSVLFAAAVLIVIFPPAMSSAEIALVVGNHLLVEVVFYALLAVCMGTRAVREKYLGAKKIIDRVASLVLGSLALRLLVDR